MTGRDMMNRKRIILFLMVLSVFGSISVKADEACKTSAYVFEDPHDSELAMLQVVTRIPENFFRVGDNAVTRLRMTDARRMIFPLSVYQPITEAENAMKWEYLSINLNAEASYYATGRRPHGDSQFQKIYWNERNFNEKVYEDGTPEFFGNVQKGDDEEATYQWLLISELSKKLIPDDVFQKNSLTQSSKDQRKVEYSGSVPVRFRDGYYGISYHLNRPDGVDTENHGFFQENLTYISLPKLESEDARYSFVGWQIEETEGSETLEGPAEGETGVIVIPGHEDDEEMGYNGKETNMNTNRIQRKRYSRLKIPETADEEDMEKVAPLRDHSPSVLIAMDAEEAEKSTESEEPEVEGLEVAENPEVLMRIATESEIPLFPK